MGDRGSSSTVSTRKVLNSPVPCAASWWDSKTCSVGASASMETVTDSCSGTWGDPVCSNIDGSSGSPAPEMWLA